MSRDFGFMSLDVIWVVNNLIFLVYLSVLKHGRQLGSNLLVWDRIPYPLKVFAKLVDIVWTCRFGHHVGQACGLLNI